MKKYLLITITFFSIAFTSCKSYEPVAFSGIENVNVTSLSQNGVEAIVTARIKNPNKVGFTIYRSEMDISVAGIDAGKVQLDKRVRIKAKSEESYTFQI
jgi:LEA14-like dessication related protein